MQHTPIPWIYQINKWNITSLVLSVKNYKDSLSLDSKPLRCLQNTNLAFERAFSMLWIFGNPLWVIVPSKSVQNSMKIKIPTNGEQGISLLYCSWALEKRKEVSATSMRWIYRGGHRNWVSHRVAKMAVTPHPWIGFSLWCRATCLVDGTFWGGR